MGGFFQAAQAAKRRAWGGNPNKIPIGQNERLAKFGTVVESCSKKVAASSVWAFADTSGGRGVDSASYAAVFRPLLPTTPHKAKMTEISKNFFIFLSFPTPPENRKLPKMGVFCFSFRGAIRRFFKTPNINAKKQEIFF
ncbi:hypothetical protein AALC16_24615 [Lachnospiraceae bacterium 29-91]